jgi:hypothetical protein
MESQNPRALLSVASHDTLFLLLMCLRYAPGGVNRRQGRKLITLS